MDSLIEGLDCDDSISLALRKFVEAENLRFKQISMDVAKAMGLVLA